MRVPTRCGRYYRHAIRVQNVGKRADVSIGIVPNFKRFQIKRARRTWVGYIPDGYRV